EPASGEVVRADEVRPDDDDDRSRDHEDEIVVRPVGRRGRRVDRRERGRARERGERPDGENGEEDTDGEDQGREARPVAAEESPEPPGERFRRHRVGHPRPGTRPSYQANERDFSAGGGVGAALPRRRNPYPPNHRLTVMGAPPSSAPPPPPMWM